MIKKITINLIVIFLLFCSYSAFAKSCLMLADLKSQKILYQKGAICNERLSPCSTFKIALSLMGFDSGILKNEKQPVWNYNEKYTALFPSWKSPHNPTTWIKDSCVWYSQVLAQTLGLEKFKYYLRMMNYGNQNIDGDPIKKDGLTYAWLSSSLKISPNEQRLFLQKMLKNKFLLTDHAYTMTRRILFVEKLKNGWSLYGKSGAGFQDSQQIGWFVGWLTKGSRTLTFVYVMAGKDIKGSIAKEQAKNFIQKDKSL